MREQRRTRLQTLCSAVQCSAVYLFAKKKRKEKRKGKMSLTHGSSRGREDRGQQQQRRPGQTRSGQVRPRRLPQWVGPCSAACCDQPGMTHGRRRRGKGRFQYRLALSPIRKARLRPLQSQPAIKDSCPHHCARYQPSLSSPPDASLLPLARIDNHTKRGWTLSILLISPRLSAPPP